jgi:hypothetical protein
MAASHNVLLGDTAKRYYLGLLREAQNGTVSRDLLGQLQRIRRIMLDLTDSQSETNDPKLINSLAWMCCRSLESTHVYYVRRDPLQAVVLHICEVGTNEAYPAFASMILSGNTGMLTRLGISPPPLSGFMVQ